MIGDTIIELRKAKAWSQAHLADAAGVSVRTIQRLELTGHCSDEILLSIAAALDVDVHYLTELTTSARNKDKRNTDRTLWKEMSPRQAFLWGVLLLVPSWLFMLSNVLKHELDRPQLYDFIVSVGEFTRLNQFADYFTEPVFLLGSAFLALVLNIMAQLRIMAPRWKEGFAITRWHFSFNLLSSCILIGSLTVIGILVGYAATENLAEFVLKFVERQSSL